MKYYSEEKCIVHGNRILLMGTTVQIIIPGNKIGIAMAP